VAANASGQVDGDSEDIAIGFEHFAVVDTAADLDGALRGVEFLDAALGRDRMRKRAFDGLEFEQEAIAEAPHKPAAFHGGRLADGGGKVLEEAVGLDIAKLAGEAERAGDIDQEEGTRHRGQVIDAG
jgi:hypothetical protein